MSTPSHKVVLIGSSGVGKTSIFLRVKDKTFYPDTTVTLDQADVTIQRFNISGKEVKIHLWDTAGMERYRSPTDSYFRGLKAVLFVYSVDNKRSFHDLSSIWNRHVNQYESTINQRRGGIMHSYCKRVLLANKIDLEDQIDTGLQDALCDKIGIDEVFRISAKTGEGVDDAFQKIAELVETAAISGPPSDANLNLQGTLQSDEGSTCAC